MCPDHQILSVYMDGELPSPWKEKMEDHLARCARCREKLESYRRASRLLDRAGTGGGVEEALKGAKERVWLKLQDKPERGFSPRPGVWSRSVAVPLPAAAAAAILFIALGALIFRQFFFTPPARDEMAAGVELDLPGIMPVSDMSGVLQYLGSQDTGDIVILRLPESRNFMRSGEPRIIKAAELPAVRGRSRPPRSGSPR
jgi:hypothetical protein